MGMDSVSNAEEKTTEAEQIEPDFWLDRFHLCSLYAAKLALSEGKLHDSEHVKRIAYELFEGGAFKEVEPEVERGCS